jgi:hypothetical protein
MITANLTPSECRLNINMPAGASQSDVIDTVDSVLCGFTFVNAWTAATLTIDGSFDGLSFNPVIGNVAAAQLVFVPAVCMIPNNMIMLGNIAGIASMEQLPRFLSLRSGSDAAPIVQANQHIFSLILHPRHPWDLKQ